MVSSTSSRQEAQKEDQASQDNFFNSLQAQLASATVSAAQPPEKKGEVEARAQAAVVGQACKSCTSGWHAHTCADVFPAMAASEQVHWQSSHGVSTAHESGHSMCPVRHMVFWDI